jgi:hypothetical protein
VGRFWLNYLEYRNVYACWMTNNAVKEGFFMITDQI